LFGAADCIEATSMDPTGNGVKEPDGPDSRPRIEAPLLSDPPWRQASSPSRQGPPPAVCR